jgi:hypothetical protein
MPGAWRQPTVLGRHGGSGQARPYALPCRLHDRRHCRGDRPYARTPLPVAPGYLGGRPEEARSRRTACPGDLETDPGADDPLDPAVFNRLCTTYCVALDGEADESIAEFAAALGLPPASLHSFGVRMQDGGLLIPEVDAAGRLVGLLRRSRSGEKLAVPGSRRGLVVPFRALPRPGRIYVAEGATDAFALHAAGLMVVGRPAARGSRAVRDWLARLVEMINAPEVIVLGDRDPKPDGRWPGLDGAVTLATILRARLRCPVRWALPMPPYKDAREQFVDGAIDRGFCIEEVLP